MGIAVGAFFNLQVYFLFHSFPPKTLPVVNVLPGEQTEKCKIPF